MTDPRWSEAKRQFGEILDLPPEEQHLRLEELDRTDAALAGEVRVLLAAHQSAGDFLDRPPAVDSTESEDDPDRWIGARIGPYRVLSLIGHGGMGGVYLAERSDNSYESHVALKLVRRDFADADMDRHFIRERQILAGLNHPNIARLFDGGVTADGSPYFVMEYVQGRNIRDYCDSRKLSIDERLRLFRSVCSAVHYAHQNLIVHRDLKPANILVTAEGTPKLLDFGIAKLIGPSAESGEMSPATTRVMTPEYASPEQVRGERITTASDIYSLGVLLYGLLTGHRPYHVPTSSPLKLIRAISEGEPGKPSEAVGRGEVMDGETRITPELVSAARDTQPEKLKRQLDGDLDNIVLKAMRKEPERRYASAEQFSDDIRRTLEGLPVTARKDTFRYRAGKFIRRNKTGVSAAVVIALLLAAGTTAIVRQTVVANRQRARAEKRFAEVRKLAGSFMFTFHDAIAALPGATAARQLVVNESVKYLNSLAEEARDDPSLQAELATAYVRLGNVQGRDRAGHLGDMKGSLESYRKAVALWESVVAFRPRDREARVRLADAYHMVDYASYVVGKLEGDSLKGFEYSPKAILICEEILESDSTYLPARRELAALNSGLGQLLATEEPASALEYYRKGIREYETCLAAGPDSITRRNLSLLYKNTGAQLHSGGRIDSALALYRKALAMDQAAMVERPNDTEIQLALSFSYGSVASALSYENRDLRGALENYQKALTLRLSVASSDSMNAFAQNAAASAFIRIGGILLEIGDRRGAATHFDKALEMHRSTPSRQVADCAVIADYCSAIASKPGVARPDRLADLKDAVFWYRKSLDLRSRIPGRVSDADAREKDRIVRELARCEAGLTGRQ